MATDQSNFDKWWSDAHFAFFFDFITTESCSRYVVHNQSFIPLQNMKMKMKVLNVRLIMKLRHVEGGLSVLLGVNVVPKVFKNHYK